MNIESNENKVMLIFLAIVLLMPIWLIPFGASYPDLLKSLQSLVFLQSVSIFYLA